MKDYQLIKIINEIQKTKKLIGLINEKVQNLEHKIFIKNFFENPKQFSELTQIQHKLKVFHEQPST